MKRGVTWTADSPTEPGFWWFRTRSAKVAVIHVIRVRGGLGCILHGVENPFPLPSQHVAWGPRVPKPRGWSEARPTEPGWYWVEGPKLLRTIAEFAETPNGYQFILPGRPWSPDQPPRDEVLAGCTWARVAAPRP